MGDGIVTRSMGREVSPGDGWNLERKIRGGNPDFGNSGLGLGGRSGRDSEIDRMTGRGGGRTGRQVEADRSAGEREREVLRSGW